jgi:flagellar basal body-associated protein FliL
MADGHDPNPDSEARKWFVIAMVCAVLYVGVVFTFVIHGNAKSESAQREEAQQHEQHN